VKYKVRHVFEYAAVRGIVFFVRALPYRAALFLGWTLASAAFYVFRFRRSIAVARIRAVFGDRYSMREADRIAWLSWRNFVFCVIDLMRLSKITPEWIRDRVAGAGEFCASLASYTGGKQGGILASPHMGAWEAAGVVIQTSGFPIFFITGRQKNPLVDAYLNRLRGSTGIETVPKGSSLLRGVVRKLKTGGLLAFLPDVRVQTEGVRIRFLGAEANVAGGMAVFARMADVPIYLCLFTRVGWSRHTMRVCPPVRPDRAAEKELDWQRMTQEVFTTIEAAIREQPEQWFWFNKRWILDPM